MKLPSISKVPKFKRFDYQPRYYDPAKEELQQRVANITREHEAKNSSNKSFEQRNISFERKRGQKKFELNVQVYIIVFMLFDLFLVFKADNISNNLWLAILVLQVSAIYLKVRYGTKKEIN